MQSLEGVESIGDVNLKLAQIIKCLKNTLNNMPRRKKSQKIMGYKRNKTKYIKKRSFVQKLGKLFQQNLPLAVQKE